MLSIYATYCDLGYLMLGKRMLLSYMFQRTRWNATRKRTFAKWRSRRGNCIKEKTDYTSNKITWIPRWLHVNSSRCFQVEIWFCLKVESTWDFPCCIHVKISTLNPGCNFHIESISGFPHRIQILSIKHKKDSSNICFQLNCTMICKYGLYMKTFFNFASIYL